LPAFAGGYVDSTGGIRTDGNYAVAAAARRQSLVFVGARTLSGGGFSGEQMYSHAMPAYPLHLEDWQTILSVQAESAATLTGLVFVAISINLMKIIVFPGLPSRAAESILQFLQVFFICTAAMVPGQSSTPIGTEILCIALFSWVMQLIAQVRYARLNTGHPKLWLIIRLTQTQLASLPFFVAVACIFMGARSGLYWLVLGFVFSFIAGVANAWVLLVEVVR
jgi:modulator of FtsH protease